MGLFVVGTRLSTAVELFAQAFFASSCDLRGNLPDAVSAWIPGSKEIVKWRLSADNSMYLC